MDYDQLLFFSLNFPFNNFNRMSKLSGIGSFSGPWSLLSVVLPLKNARQECRAQYAKNSPNNTIYTS